MRSTELRNGLDMGSEGDVEDKNSSTFLAWINWVKEFDSVHWDLNKLEVDLTRKGCSGFNILSLTEYW